jgi:methionyl-tRNA synthetase
MIKLGMDQIKYDDFAKVEFKIGEIKEAIEVEGSEKLLRLQVDFGEEKLRNIFSGIKKWYSPADLIGKKTVFVTNIKPRKIMGELSEAMIFASSAEATDGQGELTEIVSLLLPDQDLPVGSKVF